MPGNGDIGGGKSCVVNFTLKDSGGAEKQKWTGTDPDVATKASPCKIKVTFYKPFTPVGTNAFEVELVEADKKVVEIDWK